MYVDKLYERTGGVEHKFYISDFAVLSVGGQGQGMTYFHRDRLNSVVMITDYQGNEVGGAERQFDPFGKPMEPDLDENGGQLNGEGVTTRGFTQHEHINSVSLIHMNGRAYDYNLGRFLSVDPFIQFPENSQSLNPYSYLMNNPMSGIDPSGYLCEQSESPEACADRIEPGGSDDIVDSEGEVVGTITRDGNKIAVTEATGDFGKAIGRAALDSGAAPGVVVVEIGDVATLERPSRQTESPLGGGQSTPWSTAAQAVRQYGSDILIDSITKAGTEIDDVVGMEIGTTLVDISGVGPGVEAVASAIEGDFTGVAVAGVGLIIGKTAIVNRVVNPRRLISRQGRNEMTGSVVKRIRRDIRQNGFDRTKPIDVANIDGKLVIIDGHHRTKAAIGAGLRQVPVRVHSVSKEQANQLMLEAAEAAMSGR